MLRQLVVDPAVDIVGGGLAKGGIDSSAYESYGLHLKLEPDGTAYFGKGNVVDASMKLEAEYTDSDYPVEPGCNRTDVVFNFFMARTGES